MFNPEGILYGRLSGFGLSELGKQMAQAAADDLLARGRPVTALFASPLQRTRESAKPIAEAFDIPVEIDDRLVEPTNHFEGTVMRVALRSPVNWPFMVNPMRPSWGESYRSIAGRMRGAIADAFNAVDTGDVVLVSHQLSIWVAHLSLAHRPFMHDPRHRRCALSSITTLSLIPNPRSARTGHKITGQKIVVETGYTDPAATLTAGATDVGAV